MRTRPLEPRDHSDWVTLFRAYVAFYRADVPDQVVALTWSRLMDPASGMSGLCAVDEDDRPVGIALLVFHLSTWSPTSYCYLEDLYVAPQWRGRGAGKALIEAVYDTADARGSTRTYWVTEEDNESARRLYDAIAHCAPYVQYRRSR
ncbi:MAG: GNAT family N-acetyltransferase [Hyphomicrobiaceae bacterium]